LIVVKKGREKEVEKVFDKWDLSCAIIGEVSGGNRLHFFMQGELVADVPADELVLGGGAPVYEREYSQPKYFSENKKFVIDDVSEPEDLRIVADFLLSNPNIASKRWI